MENIHPIDGLRFIGTLNTTSRQLLICLRILPIIGRNQLPVEILRKRVIDWSVKMQSESSDYYASKGKVSDKDVPTSAFGHYLILLENIGFVSRFGALYSLSRIGSLVSIFLKQRDWLNPELNTVEKLILGHRLMNIDSDGLLLVLDIVNSRQIPLDQKGLKCGFKEAWNRRLRAKKEKSNPILQNLLNEKLLSLNFQWKKPEVYAEHLLMPRCQWLNDLGLLKISNAAGKTTYAISEGGRRFLSQIPLIEGEDIHDVNALWLNGSLVKCLAKSLFPEEYPENSPPPTTTQLEFIGMALMEAFSQLESSSHSRVSLLDCLLFISIIAFKDKGLLLENDDIIAILRKSIHFSGWSFSVNESGRLNEQYVTRKRST